MWIIFSLQEVYFSGSLLEEFEIGLFFNGQICIYGNMDKWIRRNIENDK